MEPDLRVTCLLRIDSPIDSLMIMIIICGMCIENLPGLEKAMQDALSKPAGYEKQRLPEQVRALSRQRRDIWTLGEHFHCALLGTCLSMQELRKTLRQARLSVAPDASDYDLHSIMVNQVRDKNSTSRQLQKFLDKKYQRYTKLLAKTDDEPGLARYWSEALESGDIAGPFWALVRHPACSLELMTRIYSDVHMLSHLQGASNRADLKRLTRLEKENQELRAELNKHRANHLKQLACRDQVIQRLEQELQDMHSRQPSEQRSGTKPLQADIQALYRRLEWLENRLADTDLQNDQLRDENSGIREMLASSREEQKASELMLKLLLEKQRKDQPEAQIGVDLYGKQVLYVGGRSRLTPHMRTLVEAHNGRFQHHDGGLEDSRAALENTLACADLVFCPIDCISHDACLKVKKHCQRQAKQFIPLRSAGLSAFARGLNNLNNDKNFMLGDDTRQPMTG